VNIKKQNESKLITENSLTDYLLSPQMIIAFMGSSVLLLFLSIDPGTRKFIPFLIGLAIAVIVIWSLSTSAMIFNCTFDRETETILAQMRSPRQFFIPRTETIHFRDVKGLWFGKQEKTSPKLELLLKSTSIRFAGEVDSKFAENIADFLAIPLYIEIDNERVTRLPKALTDKDVKVTVTFCSKCGAPLPRIYPGQKNVKCTHCGMTMFLEWNEKLTSYKSSYESE
jgi:DNA-directed RNA polymerase subunit RPC12/RpoP